MTDRPPMRSTPPDLPADGQEPDTKQLNERGAAFYCSWIFGCLFVLGGLGGLFTLIGALRLIIGLTLLPPVGVALEQRLQFKLTRMHKTAIIVVCLLIVSFTGGGEGQSDREWWEHFYADYYGG